MSDEKTVMNFIISKSLKSYIEKLAKEQSRKKDRKVTMGELIRKALVEKYGKPEEEE